MKGSFLLGQPRGFCCGIDVFRGRALIGPVVDVDNFTRL
jgi:hypothetical protein